jgi:hypothetical protein
LLFNFLKYIQPTHYFALFKKNKTSVFPVASELPKKILQLLDKDINYKSELAQQYDLSWQAIQKG